MKLGFLDHPTGIIAYCILWKK